MTEMTEPCAPSAEVAICGACLYSPGAADRACEALAPEDFYGQKARLVFGAVKALKSSGREVDLVTVTEALRASGDLATAGGSALSWLDEWSFSAEFLDEHIRLVRDKSTLRQLLKFSSEYAAKARGNVADVQRFVSQMAERVSEMALSSSPREPTHIRDALPEALARINDAHGGIKHGIPTGIAQLDHLIEGWKAPDLIVIAARPGMGKTAFALTTMNRTIEDGGTALLFSMEMGRTAIAERLVSMRSGVSARAYQSGFLSTMDVENTHRAGSDLDRLSLWIDEEGALTPDRLTMKARSMARRRPISLIVVDYLQLMRGHGGKNENREREVAASSAALKALAKEINVPVIALAQLNRGLESRMDKTPVLSDLRDSGSIEQDADIVIFIHRPGMFGETALTGQVDKTETTLIVAKHRNGPSGKVAAYFDTKTMTFRDAAPMSDADDYDTPF